MIRQLKGKIYWVKDDFAYSGEIEPKTGSTSHTVARIEHALIDEHMIKFYVCPYKNQNGDLFSYNVNLLINESGTKFTGSYSFETEPSHKGEVIAELYSNHKKYLLQGRWLEDESIFTFWAIINKDCMYP